MKHIATRAGEHCCQLTQFVAASKNASQQSTMQCDGAMNEQHPSTLDQHSFVTD